MLSDKRISRNAMAKAIKVLFETRSITSSEHRLLVILFKLTNEDDWCWPTNSWLASRLGTVPNSAGNLVSILVECGFVRRLVGQNNKRQLQLAGKALVAAAKSIDPNRKKTNRAPRSRLHKPMEGRILLPLRGNNLLEGRRYKASTFFAEFDKVELNETESRLYRELASKLHQGLKLNGLTPKKFSLTRWANEFRITINYHGEDLVVRVLDHLIKNLKSERIPMIRSGRSFKDKFENLALHMKITNERITKPELIISPKYKRLIETLQTKHWPKGTSKSLPFAVVSSYESYRNWLERIQEFIETKQGKVSSPIMRFACHLQANLPQPSFFVEQWFLQVNRQLENWTDWSGRLESFIFKPDSKRFVAFGVDLASQFCGDGSRWYKFMEILDAS
jgi:DNA-binding MarR family transcriptional regulator